MRLTETLLATAVALLITSDNLASAGNPTSKSGVKDDTPSSTTAAPGIYAELYRVKDGAVTDKMLVPLGEVGSKAPGDSYDFKQPDNLNTTDHEERAAVNLPSIFTRGPLHGLFKGFGSFLSKIKSKTKWASRRLRIAGR